MLMQVQVFQQPAIKACLFWTTKIHTLSFVFPKFIREQNICYKMMQLEQGGERLHAILNRIEKKLVTQQPDIGYS